MPHFWLIIGVILEIKLVHTLVHNLVQMAPHAILDIIHSYNIHPYSFHVIGTHIPRVSHTTV